MEAKVNSNNWILVANSARALIVDDQGANKPLTVVHVVRHPDGRRNAGELVTDRPSRSQSPTGTGTTLAPRTDPHRNSQDHFAAELAKLLDDNWQRHQFTGLVVVASNPFYGVLLNHLHPHVRKAVTRTVEHDFVDVPLNQLRERLAGA